MRADNLTLLTDLYELTMMQGYFEKQSANETVIFDVFFRENPVKNGYSIMAGLEHQKSEFFLRRCRLPAGTRHSQ